MKHIGCKRFGIQYLLKGIYTHNGLLYFHTEIRNQSNVPFDVDYITWKIVDKKVAKRTAVQERIILPLRAQNYATLVPGKKSERTVFTMAKFTIPRTRKTGMRARWTCPVKPACPRHGLHKASTRHI